MHYRLNEYLNWDLAAAFINYLSKPITQWAVSTHNKWLIDKPTDKINILIFLTYTSNFS